MPTPFFRVATEGATADGRTIQRAWIAQMAKNYDPCVYGARVFLEHIRGIVPDSPFKAYGDVTALKAREEEDGSLALYAQIEPTPELVALVKAKQKIYASIEVDPAFAETKEAYLVGLGITDSPASLGVARLSFAAHPPSPDHVFSPAVEIDLERAPERASVLSKVKALLGRATAKTTLTDARWADLTQAMETLATHSREQGDLLAAEQQRLSDLDQRFSVLTAEQAHHRTALDALRQQLEQASDGQPLRPKATGARTAVLTDC